MTEIKYGDCIVFTAMTEIKYGDCIVFTAMTEIIIVQEICYVKVMTINFSWVLLFGCGLTYCLHP